MLPKGDPPCPYTTLNASIADEQFEALVLKSEPACPACQGHNLEQLISMFSVDSASIRQNNINSARKANVKVARDKADRRSGSD